jgi:hypothetical protein
VKLCHNLIVVEARKAKGAHIQARFHWFTIGNKLTKEFFPTLTTQEAFEHIANLKLILEKHIKSFDVNIK